MIEGALRILFLTFLETINAVSNLQKSCKALPRVLCPDSRVLLSPCLLYTWGFIFPELTSAGVAPWLSLRQPCVGFAATPHPRSSRRHQCGFINNVKDRARVCVPLFQMRNNFRRYFLEPPQLKLLYDVLTWVVTQVAISYTVVPFVLLSVKPSFMFYR